MNEKLIACFPILEFFKFAHLPAHLQIVSEPFAALAERIADGEHKRPVEVQAALRKLLEAKDCAVRARLP